MFKKTRNKIVALIMSILVLLWLGSIAMIYFASYSEESAKNRDMLEEYADLYLRNGMPGDELPPDEDGNRRFQISTFYSVLLSADGNAVEILNNTKSGLSDEQLSQLAVIIAAQNRTYGTYGALAYLVTADEDATLVSMMDNTVLSDSFSTLLSYMLLFGGISVVAIFAVSLLFAGWILRPLEENAQKQKHFISDAGHELKTPLSTVSTNAELLHREIGENQWLANIQFENQRMSAMVRQMLELARAENAQVTMEKVDLSRIVTGGVLSFEAAAFDAGLTLASGIEDNICLMGNSEQLGELVSILVDNAILYSEPGGEISVLLRAVHSSAILTVTNPGKPIPADMQAKIFDRFYRGDAARTGSTPHYGLGLSIANTIAAAHHGKIAVNSQAGKTVFTVTLPKGI
jgi:signal transduction histidine kinase